MTTVIAAIVVILSVVALAAWLHFAWKSHRLSPVARARALDQLTRLKNLADPHRRVMDADAILDRALADLGYKGSMADKLRAAAKYLPNIENIWRAHKMRNRIAHEPGLTLTHAQAQLSVSAFERAVLRLCRK